jgi:signal transduction histidine kinase
MPEVDKYRRKPSPFVSRRHGNGPLRGRFPAYRPDSRLAREAAFLALVGQEMRTPLTVISSYLDMLRDDPLLATTADTRLIHDAIARNADRLLTTIDALLDLSALESGHLRLHTRPVDLAEIARRAVREVRAAADANGVVVTEVLPERHVITGDPQRLRQVLDNLLSNAVKYSPDGGPVTVTVTPDERGTAITVADSGIGVPAEDRRHLFQRFYRAANARHITVHGGGLGLTIVRAVAEAHHGTVALDDTTGAGTSVTVRLPPG